MRRLSSEYPDGGTETILGLRDWVRNSENSFILRDRTEPRWYKAVYSQSHHALDEYNAFVEVLKADLAVAPYINLVVVTSSVGGGRSVTIEELADRLIWTMANKAGGLVFDPVLFDQLFSIFKDDLDRRQVDYTTIGPIPGGFKSESLPLVFEPDLEIDRFSDGEIASCLRMNLYFGHNLGGVVFIDSGCGIRLRFSAKKIIGELSQVQMQEIGPAAQQRSERIRDILHCLRLFKRGRISIPGIVTGSPHWPFDGSLSSTSISQDSGRNNSYELSSAEAPKLRDFWSAFKRALQFPFLNAAIRRFSFAGERFRPEDSLVDLLIAAESLFLSDAGEEGDRGELTYRLSLRFAFFCDDDFYSRRERLQLMRNAYRARSVVVHGGTLDNEKLKLPREGTVSVGKFVEVVEDALRKALHKAIETTPTSNQALLDWDALITGLPKS